MAASNPTFAPQRDLPAVAKRVLILGLDGATWDVLTPLIDAGRMPHLQRLVDGGTSGIMHSTVPPITPAAWTTFLTGLSPGHHGIIDFERYDVKSNALSFNTTSALKHVRSLWQMLGERGFRVGSVNVPMTYPPEKVNGFLISGFEAVNTRGEFTSPPELKQEILERWPDYSFKNTWRRKARGGLALYRENVAQITHSFHQGAEVLEFCGDHFGWDALMIVYKLVDNLQHKVWRYLDPRTRDRFPEYCRIAEDCFAELDVAIGRILDYAARHEAHVFMMSDHGHGSLEGKAQPNLMLRDWGYLRLRSGGARAQTRVRKLIARRFRRKGRFAGNFSLEDDLAVDFTRTRAAVMHAGMAGFLYLNLKGRQDTGIVDPADYERLRDEMKDRFESATCRDPDGKTIPIFQQVHKPEALYDVTRDQRGFLPDLILTPTPRLAVVRKIRGHQPVNWIPLHRMEGTHRPEGVFAVHGPGVPAGKHLDTGLIHATPTILAMLGLRVPAALEGKVITEAFDPPLAFEIDHTQAQKTGAGKSAEQVYTKEEMAVLSQRLADLGYLE